MNISKLKLYEKYLGKRYLSFSYVFNALNKKRDNIIVELGTSRSFVSGGIPGCMNTNEVYWNENKIVDWDWGAGIFSRVCAEIIDGTQNILYTVDPNLDAINICMTMTSKFTDNIEYLVITSTNFLKSVEGKIDLLYMDHHETCEEGALLHLSDAKILLEKDLLAEGGIILIDDVHLAHVEANQIINNPIKEFSQFGKGKYSIPFLIANGFQLVFEGYQAILIKV